MPFVQGHRNRAAAEVHGARAEVHTDKPLREANHASNKPAVSEPNVAMPTRDRRVFRVHPFGAPMTGSPGQSLLYEKWEVLLGIRSHFLVWIVKPPGCHCTDAFGGEQISQSFRSTSPFSDCSQLPEVGIGCRRSFAWREKVQPSRASRNSPAEPAANTPSRPILLPEHGLWGLPLGWIPDLRENVCLGKAADPRLQC